MTQAGGDGSLGAVLAARRRRRFVGRDAEIEVVRAALAADDPPFSVLYVHGPGGIGKTSLLAIIAALATDAGAAVVRIDGQATVARPDAVLEVLAGSADVEIGDADAPIGTRSGRRLVLLMPSMLSPVDWDAWGQRYPEPADADDRDATLHLIRTAEGDRSAAIARRWWDRQPHAFFVVRDDHGDVRGVITLLDLTAVSDADRAADPGAQAAWAHAHRQAPPRPGKPSP